MNKKTLLLHSCCGPCSSYVLEYLSKYFKITVYYYNPNMDTKDEFFKRLNEQIKVINKLPSVNEIELIEADIPQIVASDHFPYYAKIKI